MDLIEGIRRELGFIQVNGQPGVAAAIRELRGNLARALNSLSDELYSKTTHFLLEFIQNADDNKYAPGNAPTLNISLEPGWLVIQCNELGFNEENVKALCKIGASTKKNQKGYIGEKGIGFKAVFKIADVVYVLSRQYSFYFDKNQELGMIAPIWTKQQAVRRGWTTFRLKLTDDNVRHMTYHLNHIQPSLLLFLRKLRQVEVTYEGKKICFYRTESRADIILTSTRDGVEETERYLVVKHKVKTWPEDSKRWGITESQLVLAFPLSMDEMPIVQDQEVYAFLPLRNYGFKFMIQGDFLTPSSREDILSDLKWNITLRDAIPKAFAQAISEFKLRPSLQFRWMRFIPDGVSDSFMKPVQDNLFEELRQEPIILCSDGEYHPPVAVLMEPYCGPDRNPLIPTRFLKERFYISTQYDLETDRAVLLALGVRPMSRDDFVSGLGEMYNESSFLGEQDETWHESVCSHLLDILDAEEHRQWSIKSLKIIPLIDGSWVSSWLPNIHFNPSTADIPLDLGVYFVHPLDPPSARYRLFQRMGIKEAEPEGIARRILDIHAKADENINRIALIAHVRYLFDHRNELESVLTNQSLTLWVSTGDGNVLRSSDLYMDHPRYQDSELSLSQFLKAPFISAEYMGLYPADSKDFKTWCNWLQDQLGIQTTPRVVEGALSPEFSTILQSLKTAQLLRVLKQYWPDVSERVVNSPEALAELRATQVTCTNGKTEKLEATFLATTKLVKYDDLPFLPVVDADDASWQFLDQLGVSLKLDGAYSLKRLVRLSESPDVKTDEVTELYMQLQIRLEEGDNTKAIRQAFKRYKLILCTRDKLQKKQEWLGLSDVVWVAPISVQSKCQLAWQYTHPRLKLFFIAVGVAPDCSPEILLHEIKPIAAEWKGKTLTNEIYRRVSDILLDIDKVLYYASRRSKPIPMGWIYALRNEAIFPVNTPDLGLTLMSATDTFYLPDRTGALAQLFAGHVPIIANPVWVDKPAKSLQLIKYILEHDEFKPYLKCLDQVVKGQTHAVGKRVRDAGLSKRYTERVGLIRRLLLYTPAGRQSRVFFREISVHRVDNVETSYTIDSVTRSIPDQLALEIQRNKTSEELIIIITNSCRADVRDMILSKKMAQLLALEPAAVHLALTNNLDAVETLFNHLAIAPVADYQEEEEELYATVDDGSGALPVTFENPNAGHDLSDVFISAEPQLREAGFRAKLTPAKKYALNYKFGASGAGGNRDQTFMPASQATAINIPSPTNYPAPSIDGTWQSPTDSNTAILDTLGEFYVLEVLRKNLPGVGVEHWTSELRKHMPEYKDRPFEGTARAAFTYQDTEGKFTEILYGLKVRDRWNPRWPTYHVDVKTTEGPMKDYFRMTKENFDTAAELTISDPNVAPTDVYVLVRVADIKQPERSFRLLPDPHRLLYDKQIGVKSFLTSMSVVL